MAKHKSKEPTGAGPADETEKLREQLAAQQEELDRLNDEREQLDKDTLQYATEVMSGTADRKQLVNELDTHAQALREYGTRAIKQRDVVIAALRRLVLALKPLTFNAENKTDAERLKRTEKEADELLTAIDQQGDK